MRSLSSFQSPTRSSLSRIGLARGLVAVERLVEACGPCAARGAKIASASASSARAQFAGSAQAGGGRKERRADIAVDRAASLVAPSRKVLASTGRRRA